MDLFIIMDPVNCEIRNQFDSKMFCRTWKNKLKNWTIRIRKLYSANFQVINLEIIIIFSSFLLLLCSLSSSSSSWWRFFTLFQVSLVSVSSEFSSTRFSIKYYKVPSGGGGGGVSACMVHTTMNLYTQLSLETGNIMLDIEFPCALFSSKHGSMENTVISFWVTHS